MKLEKFIKVLWLFRSRTDGSVIFGQTGLRCSKEDIFIFQFLDQTHNVPPSWQWLFCQSEDIKGLGVDFVKKLSMSYNEFEFQVKQSRVFNRGSLYALSIQLVIEDICRAQSITGLWEKIKRIFIGCGSSWIRFSNLSTASIRYSWASSCQLCIKCICPLE